MASLSFFRFPHPRLPPRPTVPYISRRSRFCRRSHQASMNGESIFGAAEDEGGDEEGRQRWRWRRIVGASRGTSSRRQRRREGDARVGQNVVFPQGKHEHILARGLFRQIGDCCGGKRKGSSAAAAAAAATTTTTTTTNSARAPLLLTPPFRRPPVPIKHTAVRATNTLRFLSRERDIILKSAVDAAAERQRRTSAQTAEGTEAEVAN